MGFRVASSNSSANRVHIGSEGPTNPVRGGASITIGSGAGTSTETKVEDNNPTDVQQVKVPSDLSRTGGTTINPDTATTVNGYHLPDGRRGQRPYRTYQIGDQIITTDKPVRVTVTKKSRKAQKSRSRDQVSSHE